MTIRRRLTLWYAALLTIIIILFGATTFSVMRFTMINNIDNTLNETANLIATNSRLGAVPSFGAPTRIEIELASLDLFRASGVYVQAWEIVEGEPIFKDKSANLAPITDPLDPDTLGMSDIDGIINNVNLRGVDLRVLTKPILLGDRLVGNIQVAVDLETINEATELMLLIMLISCGIAIFGAGALSLWFSDRALKPIEGITEAAASIAGTNDLSTRLNWQGPADELGRLTSVFNQMMGRIEHLFTVQQRFVADISHELRTPLTTIQGNVELGKRYGMDTETIEAINDETKRMSRLVNDLLMLARADYGGLTIELHPIDLDVVVLSVFEQSHVLVQDRDLTVSIGAFEPAQINGNGDRLRQMLLNLVSNAIKFTKDGGKITLSLEIVGKKAVVSVTDDGIGIAEDEITHVFDRFYQIDPSRNHALTQGGFGLGLSIVKWIVDAHDGEIIVESALGKGSTFKVVLPLHQTDDHHITDTHEVVQRTRLPLISWSRQRDRQQKHGSRYDHEQDTHDTHHHHHYHTPQHPDDGLEQGQSGRTHHHLNPSESDKSHLS